MWACILSPLGLGWLTVSAVFWITAAFVPGHYLIEFADGFTSAFCFTVAAVYAVGIKRAVCHKPADAGDIIRVGIAGGWLAAGVSLGWRLVARVTGAEWMLQHPFLAYALLLSAAFAAMHLAVRGSLDDQEQRALSPLAVAIVAVTAFMGTALGFLAISLHTGLIERLRPW